MDSETAMTAFRDQQRSAMTAAIRRWGVWNTCVSGDPAECECCRATPAPRGGTAPWSIRPSPTFCYSTGLFGVGHPELLVFSLEMRVASELLTGLAHGVRHGRDLTPGERLDVPQLQLTLLVEELPNPGEILLAANDYYRRPRGNSVPALQLTWADGQRRFPWDEGSALAPADQPRPGSFRA